jgi:hypothetical protein
MPYTLPDSTSPEINEGRKACLDGKDLNDNPYHFNTENIKWCLWKTGCIEQYCINKREKLGIPMPDNAIKI